MTLSAFCLKWKAYLAFVLICHAGQRIEGYPHEYSQNISELIEKAYQNGGLLRSEKWSKLHGNSDRDATRPAQRDLSRQMYSSMTSAFPESQYTRRKLLGVSSTKESDGDGKIVFPTDTMTSTLTPRPTPICYNSTFCENVANYPKNLVNEAIARNQNFRFLETIDQMPGVENRIDVADEIELCRFQDKVVYPQAAKNKENELLFVVNQDNFKQGIRIEICINEGHECAMSDGFAEGYKTSCKQKYILRELVAMTSDGQVIRDQFKLPSSCCCHVKFIGNANLRFGADPELDLPQNRTVVPRIRKRK